MTPARRPPRLLLASGSPRRHQLLRSIGLSFAVASPDIDETPRPDERPIAYVERLAREKAAAVESRSDDLVVAADTTVALEDEILGKPVDVHDARRMLLALSDRSHAVHTGLAVRADGQVRTWVETTSVTMVPIEAPELEWYLATGEPLDKAGAYALQGAGSRFVRSLDGSASNVVGLPLAALADLLQAAGWPLAAFRAG